LPIDRVRIPADEKEDKSPAVTKQLCATCSLIPCLNSCGGKQAGAVMHRQKVNLVLSNPIDDAVAANNDLSDALDSQLRNGPPREWVARQPICRAQNPVGECRRQLRRIPSEEQQVARTPALGVRGSSLGIAADLTDGGLRYACLLEPFRHTLADPFLIDQFTAVRLLKTSLDFVEQVKPIQGIFDAGVVRELLNGLQYLLFRLHGNSPVSLPILALTARET
jgi:hypothetical protein